MSYITQTHVGTTNFASRWNTFRDDFAKARAKRAIYRTTKSELISLTDRELADIGITRSMINSIAMEAAGYK